MMPQKNIIPFGPLGAWLPERTEKILITPDQAALILEQYNSRNRQFSDAFLQKLTNTFKSGLMVFNGEPIIFGYDHNTDRGILLDGQHRLKACAISGVSFLTDVKFGLDPQVFLTIDRGKMRNNPDDLSIRGEQNVNLLAATVKMSYAYMKGVRDIDIANKTFSSIEMFSFIDNNSSIRDSVHYAQVSCSGRGHKFPIMPRILASSHFLFGLKSQPARDEYFERLASGAEMQEGNPILTARNKIFSERIKIHGNLRNTNHAQAFTYLMILFSSWNHFRRGTKLTKFSFRESVIDVGNEKALLLPEII